MEDPLYSSDSNFLPLYRPEHPMIPVLNLIAYGFGFILSIATIIVSVVLPNWPPQNIQYAIILCAIVNLVLCVLSALLTQWYREGLMMPRVRVLSFSILGLVCVTSCSLLVFCILKPHKS